MSKSLICADRELRDNEENKITLKINLLSYHSNAIITENIILPNSI